MSCMSMINLNNWKPRKFEGHGAQQISEARDLLKICGANLSHEDRVMVQSLLEHAEELRPHLKRKCPLARLKLAKRYDEIAGDALRTIEGKL